MGVETGPACCVRSAGGPRDGVHEMNLHRCAELPLRAGASADKSSVADHTFGVALLALLFPRGAAGDVDRHHCVALAIVHDLAESIVGDVTPHDRIDPAEKHRREAAARPPRSAC